MGSIIKLRPPSPSRDVGNEQNGNQQFQIIETFVDLTANEEEPIPGK